MKTYIYSVFLLSFLALSPFLQAAKKDKLQLIDIPSIQFRWVDESANSQAHLMKSLLTQEDLYIKPEVLLHRVDIQKIEMEGGPVEKKEYQVTSPNGFKIFVEFSDKALKEDSSAKAIADSGTLEPTGKVVRINDYSIILNFTPQGSEKLHKLTTQGIDRRLAIILNGQLFQAPKIVVPITDGSLKLPFSISNEITESFFKKMGLIKK